MKVTNKILYRQGDVGLKPCILEEGDKVVKVESKNGRLILARGEATGHHHSVDTLTANLFSVNDGLVLVVAEPTTLDHQEHGTIEIMPGIYWIVRQREYHRSEVRRVQD